MAFSKDAVCQENGPLKDFPQRGWYTGIAQKAVSATCSGGHATWSLRIRHCNAIGRHTSSHGPCWSNGPVLAALGGGEANFGVCEGYNLTVGEPSLLESLAGKPP